MNNRITSIRRRVINSRQLGDPSAGKLREQSFSKTEGEPTVIREAKALAHYYRHQTLIINENELIVGARPGLTYDPNDKVTPAIFGRRSWNSPWKVTESVEPFFQEGMLSGAGNHTTLHYPTIFSSGFMGIINHIEERITRLSQDDSEYKQKRDFLEALKIVAKGYIELSERYADYALQLSMKTDDVRRKKELETIAQNCQRVPARSPTNFWEACQCAWFSFFFLPDSPGRVDQYLYPFYKQEIENGTLTNEFAKELLSCLWLKYFESVGATSGVSAHNHLTLGGVKPDGSDASNEVTYLCLEVTEELAILRPQVGLRWHRNTPRPLLKQAVKALRSGTAIPDFCSDEQIVYALNRIGVSLEDARDFSLSGCHEVIVTGKAQMGSVEGFVNMPKILRMTLGLEPALQNNVCLSSIDSYETFWDRLTESMDLVAKMAHEASIYRDQGASESPGGNLQASLVTLDCIENAKGYTQGGARYNFCNWDIIGIANLVDSLTAIRILVFEDKRYSLEELAELLSSNWENHEILRQEIIRKYPHFGNDVKEVDELAARVIETFSNILKRHKPFRGGEYILGTTAGGENMHIEFGRVTGATPDGRKEGETLADSLGAAQGRDRQGVTALLNSVAKLPHQILPTATTLNVKLDPKLLDKPSDIEKIARLIDGHFRTGGQQIQFNMVDRELLLKAKRNPEMHSNLMVRVAGYSAPFTSLWEDLQDEIIARTGHEL